MPVVHATSPRNNNGGQLLIANSSQDGRAALVRAFGSVLNWRIRSVASLEELVDTDFSRTTVLVVCFSLVETSNERARRLLAALSRRARVLIALFDGRIYDAAEVLMHADGWVFLERSMQDSAAVLAVSEARLAVIPADLIIAFDLKKLRARELGLLSATERDVLRALGAGLSNQVIARRIGCSEARAKVLTGRILRHMRFRNRTQAGVYAAREFGPDTAPDWGEL